jgi:hypothetical protein
MSTPHPKKKKQNAMKRLRTTNWPCHCSVEHESEISIPHGALSASMMSSKPLVSTSFLCRKKRTLKSFLCRNDFKFNWEKSDKNSFAWWKTHESQFFEILLL